VASNVFRFRVALLLGLGRASGNTKSVRQRPKQGERCGADTAEQQIVIAKCRSAPWRIDGIMKKKKIETHRIGLVGQAPSRRGDPRRPLAGPNGRKIARLGGMSYDELVACRRKHLNTHYDGKRDKRETFDHAKGNANAADILLDWRVERIVLLGKNVARCFGFGDVPFLAEVRIYGRRFLIFPHPSGINRWWNERGNQRRARQLLQRFLRGETVPVGFRKSDDSSRTRSQTSSTRTSANGSCGTIFRPKVPRTSRGSRRYAR